jgi:RNA polymerase sigma-70 factor (ECF subfamily)
LRNRIVQDEEILLARAHQFDTDALAQIHDQYYAPLFRYIAFRVSDRDTAEELTSEVFVRFLSALRGRRPPRQTLRGWLYGVAAHIVSDYHRTRYRTSEVVLEESLISQQPEPDKLAEATLDHEELQRGIATLTDEQQHVLALRFSQELPIQDVARILKKTEGAVKQLQARAIAALTRHMAPGIVD